MTDRDAVTQLDLTSLSIGDRTLTVSCRIVWDGIEFVGQLWFTDPATAGPGLPDRSVIPGRDRDEVIALARRLTADELAARFARAVAEKRRHHELRSVTEQILGKIKYLNQVARSMRSGLLDVEGATGEMAAVEQQLHSLVDELRHHAGAESWHD